MFLGQQQCSDGYVWEPNIQECVATWSTDVHDCIDPNKVWNELTQSCVPIGGASGPIPWNFILIGAAVLLVLSFAGGRASKKSTGRIYSRTSTRTLYT